MRAPTLSLNRFEERELWGWQPKNFLEVIVMRYVVSVAISIVVWKVVISPAVAEAVKVFETAARVLGG
jgi:hypothetical protein